MKRVLPLVAAFLAGVVVACAVGAMWDAPGRSEPETASVQRASGGEGGSDGAFHEVMDRLDARTERILRHLESGSARRALPEGGEPVARAADASEELRLLRELERSLAELLARPADASEALQRLRSERPEPDWAALDALVATWETDVESARREVQLLSEAEVLRRYGSPSLIYVRDGVVRWVYGRDFVPQWDAYRMQLVLVLEGGLVRGMYVERM